MSLLSLPCLLPKLLITECTIVKVLSNSGLSLFLCTILLWKLREFWTVKKNSNQIWRWFPRPFNSHHQRTFPARIFIPLKYYEFHLSFRIFMCFQTKLFLASGNVVYCIRLEGNSIPGANRTPAVILEMPLFIQWTDLKQIWKLFSQAIPNLCFKGVFRVHFWHLLTKMMHFGTPEQTTSLSHLFRIFQFFIPGSTK